MATIVKLAEKYTAFHYPNGGASETRSRINIYAADNHALYVIFKADDVQLPTSKFQDSVGVGYEHAHRYPYYLDLLRNEGPVWITINPDIPSFVVYASQEPVGEGEF